MEELQIISDMLKSFIEPCSSHEERTRMIAYLYSVYVASKGNDDAVADMLAKAIGGVR